MVPKGWSQSKLGEVVREFRGGGTPSRKQPAYWGGEIRWASVKDLNDDRISVTEESITEEGLHSSSASVVPADTVILATRMAVGKAVTAAMPVAINQDLKGLIPTEDLHSQYLKLWLNWRENQIAALASGTTVKGIRLSSLHSLSLVLPPLPEQQKIAAILSSVDDVTAATRKVIERTKRAKKGLLQTLMTRGIGHTRFKKTELGGIPEEWEVRSLGDITATSITYGVVQPGPRVEDGVKFVRGGDFPDGYILIDELRTIGSDVHRQYQRTVLQEGDVLLSLVGQPGSSAVVPSDLSGANIARQVALIRPKPFVDAAFLNYCISHPLTQRRLLAQSIGSVQQVINLRDVRGILMPIPPSEEQRQIAERLEALDHGVEQGRRSVERLQILKRGLMQDLLTGRVRVQPD